MFYNIVNMQFHLDFKPTISKHAISHQQITLLVGSCFSENIASRLNQLYFNVSANPFGILFNPDAIYQTINRIIDKHYFQEEDVFEKHGLWFCLDTHTHIYNETRQGLLQALNSIIDNWHAQLKNADWLLITFGSAYGYKHKELKKTVANCHKLPQQLFNKELIEVSETVKQYSDLQNKLSYFNDKLKLIYTVSPVKHLRDGVIENSLSKAILIQAVHQIIRANNNCYYFPAYELVTDDLRDYRFYKQDMAHPNEQAIAYVWQKFTETYFTTETQLLNKQLQEINTAKQHKPLQPNSKEFLEFKSNYTQKAKELMEKFDWLKINLE